MHIYYTVDLSIKDTLGPLNLVLITEVSSIQRSLNTLQYYTGTQNGVFIIEVSAIQRFVIERFHCTGNAVALPLQTVIINFHNKYVYSNVPHFYFIL